MTRESYISSEFPDDVLAIDRLRSTDPVFAEICEDLELMARELPLFTEQESLRKQGVHLDVQASLLALRDELVEFLHRKSTSAADDSVAINLRPTKRKNHAKTG